MLISNSWSAAAARQFRASRTSTAVERSRSPPALVCPAWAGTNHLKGEQATRLSLPGSTAYAENRWLASGHTYGGLGGLTSAIPSVRADRLCAIPPVVIPAKAGICLAFRGTMDSRWSLPPGGVSTAHSVPLGSASEPALLSGCRFHFIPSGLRLLAVLGDRADHGIQACGDISSSSRHIIRLNQHLGRNAEARRQAPDHFQRQRAHAIEHLRNSGARAEERF